MYPTAGSAIATIPSHNLNNSALASTAERRESLGAVHRFHPGHSRWPLVALALLGASCHDEPPLGVARVELDRLEGGYFEVAKLPRPTQADCRGTTSYYRRMSDTELAVVHECHEGSLDGPIKRVAARALVTDRDEPAKLSLDFGGFYGDYWIVDAADDYRYFVVGHPSRDYLWILSRTAGMTPDDYEGVLDRMRAADFEVSRLELTEQGPDTGAVAPSEPSKDVPELSRHGCNLSGNAPSHDSNRGLALLALLIATLLRRRRST